MHYISYAGVKRGDVIALFMENRPEHVYTWLGLSKIGVLQRYGVFQHH